MTGWSMNVMPDWCDRTGGCTQAGAILLDLIDRQLVCERCALPRRRIEPAR